MREKKLINFIINEKHHCICKTRMCCLKAEMALRNYKIKSRNIQQKAKRTLRNEQKRKTGKGRQ